MTTHTELVPFHGDQILVVLQDDRRFVAIRPLCDRFEIARQPQQRKIMARPELWGGTMLMLPSTSGDQQTLCIPFNRLAMWLASINPKKVAGQFRDALIRYQIECADVLDAHFRDKREAADVEIAYLNRTIDRLSGHLFASNRIFGRIAALFDAGTPRYRVAALIGRSKEATDDLIDELGRIGAIHSDAWWYAGKGPKRLPPEIRTEPDRAKRDVMLRAYAKKQLED